ncbi:LuxR C-terminal-related transcriptional regulator [Amycolatopsis pigmentata]|uniref:LuxR C-terminal-related transcriptional regulator n=1 Tax=Amycolatopsis pigmentata TaxID=450801 RepID=A0ABW5FIU5_9PSEU
MARRTSHQLAGNLPAVLTSFVGRRDELSEARHLLSTTRLLTLTGVGGVGKTRLALRVAKNVQRSFPDGAWFVDLTTLNDGLFLPSTVAAALGHHGPAFSQDGKAPVEILAESLVDKEMLLILDNCEHLLEPCAALAHGVLSTAPGVRILATSREPLGVAGEQLMTVLPLPVPEVATADLDVVEPAVALLTERARLVAPRFAVTPENRDSVIALCRRLDGLPLAIELAAVRLRILSVEQVTERLDDSFRLLTTADPTVPPRRQTLRAAIDWSYQLCSPEERRLWAWSSVFSGGFDLEAAEEVCAGPGTARDDLVTLLGGLVDKSVLLCEDQGPHVRYRLLESIRGYGRELLAESGEEKTARRRHRDCYGRQVADAEANWVGPDQAEWSRRLWLEVPNLRAAMEFALSEPGEACRALEIAGSFWCHRFMWNSLQSGVPEGRYWVERALAAACPGPSQARAKALWVNAWFAQSEGRWESASRLLEECRVLAESIHDDAASTGVLQLSGFAALAHRDYELGKSLVGQALTRYRAAGDLNGEWYALHHLALANALGDDTPVEAVAEESLALARKHQARWSESVALSTAGICALRLGDSRRAARLIKDSLRLKKVFNDDLGIGQCLEVLAWIAQAEGHDDRGARLLGAAEGVWQMIGGPRWRQPMRHWHDHCEAELRQALGDDAFDSAFRSGMRLAPDDVLTFALQETPTRAPSRSADPTHLLTRRENEIAGLIADGMSNKGIAQTLVIAPRTAESHVENILKKLGFTSRSQIASWMIRHRVPQDDKTTK